MLGNGVSFSPGDGGYPDLVSIDDNARLQKKLVDDVFDGRQLSLAYGYSMGGMQALAFARLFPDAAARVMVVCGAAGCELFEHEPSALFVFRAVQYKVYFILHLSCWSAAIVWARTV